MTRERIVWALALLGLALGAWWLSVNTEWVDEETPRAAQGEARDNPVYALEQLLRRLGMKAEHHQALTALPPPGARLVLLSPDWELMPERAEELHQWVLRGGHLVLPEHENWEGTPLKRWVPVDEVYVKGPQRRKPQQPPLRPGLPASAVLPAETSRGELASTPPLWGDTENIAACNLFQRDWILRARRGQEPAWSLAMVDGTRDTKAVVARQDQALQELLDEQTQALEAARKAARDAAKAPRPAQPSTQVLRMPVGQGSVTVINTHGRVFFNARALDCEHPLLLAAALQAEPGATAWIYLNEKREPLVPWLWQTGWIAIVVGGLALAAALWRAAVRFGPRLAAEPRLRRSISEQVQGLGAYLQGGGREALLAAQQRALAEAASRTLPRYARLPLGEKTRAVAQATGLAANELATAMTAKFCTRAELLKQLPLLEAARRRLQHKSSEERQQP